jgi:hypothetical protein
MTCALRPIRTTIMIGGLGALTWCLVDLAPVGTAPRALLHTGLLWSLTAWYAGCLACWGRRGRSAVIFPLLVLALWCGYRPYTPVSVAMAVAVIGWIRSGLCYPGPVRQTVGREGLIGGGGVLLVAALASGNSFSGAVGVWLFFLVQALYFVIFEPRPGSAAAPASRDPFAHARQRAEHILARY